MFAAEKVHPSCLTTKEPCWMPQISNFFPKNSSGMDICSTVEDYDCMSQIFKMIKASVSTNCTKHCEESTYRVSKSQTPIPESGIVRNHKTYVSESVVLSKNLLIFQSYMEGRTTAIQLNFASDTVLTSTEYEVRLLNE